MKTERKKSRGLQLRFHQSHAMIVIDAIANAITIACETWLIGYSELVAKRFVSITLFLRAKEEKVPIMFMMLSLSGDSACHSRRTLSSRPS